MSPAAKKVADGAAARQKLEDGGRPPCVVAHKGSLINEAACRRFIFDYAKGSRFHEFGRIDPSVFAELNGVLRKHMRHVVSRNPSCGKTIR